MNLPPHKMILASAGSGKTHALTERFVQLLAHGALPERIVALTFTRKAAGEFFDQILERLAQAAADPGQARRLATAIEVPDLGRADFLKLLRAVIDAMPRLSLGTLDGFFARVVRTFPLELGLDGEFEIMDVAPARRERRRVLQRMFAAARRPDAAQREFIEAFKRATFGIEEKRLAVILDGFLDNHAEKFLDAPLPAQWGDANRIWPEGCAWLSAARGCEAAVQALRTALVTEALGNKQRTRLEDFFSALTNWLPGTPLPAPVEYLLKNVFKAWPGLEEITVERKKVALSPPAREALRAVVEGIAGAEFLGRIEMTRGLFTVLQGYERNYHEIVRRAGRLTFADVLRLLLPATGAPVLSGGLAPEGEEARLAIDWRLDAKFDHWLLDEFQDTSFAQWSVLRNLIDEAVQDAEGRRSLFYVGDVKQAIFAWRGGDTRLFREIFDQYNHAAPGLITEGRLDTSWRSGPAVIAMINRVFGRAAVLQDFLPPTAAGRWTGEWRDHTSAHPALEGFAELRHANDENARFAETLRLLREIRPLERGLEAAVLVQTNEIASALAEYLRREGGLAAMAESDLRIAGDNPVTTALLALLRAAAHPGDTLAQEHLKMTPLAALMAEDGLAAADALTERLLAEIHEGGFAGTLERWLRKLGPVIAGDQFGMERGRMLVAAAAEFDANASRDVAEFLEFAALFARRETEMAGTIRVMTIHKAKGLGFDVVILPDLEGETLAKRREGLAIHKAADRSVTWVLDLPTRMFAEHDPVLAAQLAADEADAAYENLCLLYVAMTRAKRAMYVITEPAAATSTSRNYPNLLAETVGETWSEGAARWFEKIALTTEVEQPRLPCARIAGEPAPRAARRPARTPSSLATGWVGGGQLFALEASGAIDFGHAVHALFATAEWSGAGEGRETPAASPGPGAAAEEVRACLGAPELASLWARKAGAEVWRERAFEIVLDDTWVTGVFDRVVIEHDPTGRVTSATVIDFKTDRVDSDASVAAAVVRHAAQLNLYRRVVAVLTGLSLPAVTGELVFTRLRRRVAVPPA